MTNPKVDAYIRAAAPFAQPILIELRVRLHAACPELSEELKWGMPSFIYNKKILAHMAAFKQHASFGFWRRDVVAGAGDKEMEAMGQFGKLTTVKELPTKTAFKAMVKAAMQLVDAGPAARKAAPKHARPKLAVPDDLAAALKKNKAARATFDGFSPSHQREYIEWIVEAKREETRERRLGQTIEWLAQGKPRNWKYQNC